MAQNRVKKIAVIGAESSGKTWLCEALAAHYNTVWVPEYAREYFNDSDIYNYTLVDLERIARRQLEMEEEALKNARRFLFCDTTLITLKIWAELEFQTTPPLISQQLDRVSYDHYFITNNEIAWAADPLRQNKHSRELLMRMNEEEVKRTGIPWSIVKGTDRQRLEDTICVIDALTHLK